MNIVWYGFNRIGFVVGAVLLLFTIFLGHFNALQVTMRNSYARGFGKTTYAGLLAGPIIITNLYCS